MIQNKTRIRITWYTLIALTLICVLAILKDMEGVASSSVVAIGAVAAGYQASKAYSTKKVEQ